MYAQIDAYVTWNFSKESTFREGEAGRSQGEAVCAEAVSTFMQGRLGPGAGNLQVALAVEPLRNINSSQISVVQQCPFMVPGRGHIAQLLRAACSSQGTV